MMYSPPRAREREKELELPSGFYAAAMQLSWLMKTFALHLFSCSDWDCTSFSDSLPLYGATSHRQSEEA